MFLPKLTNWTKWKMMRKHRGHQADAIACDFYINIIQFSLLSLSFLMLTEIPFWIKYRYNYKVRSIMLMLCNKQLAKTNGNFLSIEIKFGPYENIKSVNLQKKRKYKECHIFNKYIYINIWLIETDSKYMNLTQWSKFKY